MVDGGELLDEKDAARLLKFSIRALQAWRCRGGGLKFVRISARAVRYRRSDLDAWVSDRICTSTSDPGLELSADLPLTQKQRARRSEP
jgi:hypothetical protein